MAIMNWESLKNDMTAIISVAALALSGISFYVSYFYKSQDLEVMVTAVSYNTNQDEVYMTVAFSNGGNRDAALLRVEPAIWQKRGDKPNAEWIALDTRVGPTVPLTDPKVPAVVKAGGVEVVRLSAKLSHDNAERAASRPRAAHFSASSSRR